MSFLRRLTISALLTCASLTAQQGQPARTQGVTAVNVHGMVVNSAGGDPVEGATVILRALDTATGTSYAAQTDGSGQFTIPGVRFGTYVPSVVHQGFTFETSGAAGAPPPRVTFEPGQAAKDLVLRMTPHGVISGRVLDEDGDPMRGAPVEALHRVWTNGKGQLGPAQQVSTNDKGEFRLFDLPPGTYYLEATARPAMLVFAQPLMAPTGMSHAQPQSELVATYYPNAVEASQAVPVDLAPGAQLDRKDIQLRRETLYSIRGQVEGENDPRNPGRYQLTLDPLGGLLGLRGPMTSRMGNYFVFSGVVPGSYIVSAVDMAGAERRFARQRVDVVAADVNDVDLTFSPGSDIKGSVRFEGPAPGPLPNLQVTLRPEGSRPLIVGPLSAAIKPDGTFTLSDVTPQAYMMRVAPQNGFYLKSVRIGEQEFPNGRVDLTGGPAAITVLLGTDVGQVEGTVHNESGEPVARARVTLIPMGVHLGREDLERYAFSNDEGGFTLRSVAPGSYEAFAWEDVPIGAPQDPDFRKPFEKQGISVTLASSGHQTIDLQVIPASAIANQLQ